MTDDEAAKVKALQAQIESDIMAMLTAEPQPATPDAVRAMFERLIPPYLERAPGVTYRTELTVDASPQDIAERRMNVSVAFIPEITFTIDVPKA